ncbi:hypothetical protein L202_04552 [Cryptococcus amylolentus CBS 6039]|uniref:Uncharacterized protein n=1 Tax=Cryptococcus amylolentus CBS 6039 TaxID=1295533 RepID=A0A1E3HRQ4_9TREE|nr:hypothetical protein L202_04552 [Cryptococcus amylolentus CBS 6039]ODN79048.1 hypothetical protein L202_04552 [Cryptococcus amylolentus CBS 6039]
MLLTTPTVLLAVASFAAVSQGSVIKARAETHQVTLVNNCGSGNPVFLYEGNDKQGSGTVSGPLRGGVAWMDSYGDCQSSGVNCGIVEFTLINESNLDPNGNPYQNSADYSLLTGDGLGNHQFTYNMNFDFNGDGCNKGPGACTGNSAAQCPGAYLGSATEGGAPTQCVADNVGITITFC